MPIKYPKANAEKVIFRDQFFSDVYGLGIDLNTYGGLTLSKGLILNGTTQYATVNGMFLANKTELSIEIVFTPDFNWDEDVDRGFFDAPTSHAYYLHKRNNANGNVLRLALGNTDIVSIASAAYSDYWYQGESNHLVIASVSGSTDVYLNGNLIADSVAVAWTPKQPTLFYIGMQSVNFFDGVINVFNVYNRKLTSEEVIDRILDRTFKKVDVRQLEFFLPLRTHFNNGVSELTSNIGVVGGDTIKWGDGNVVTTMPKLLPNNGASFDGGDYIDVASPTDLINTETYLMGCLFKCSFTNSRYMWDLRSTTAKGIGLFMNLGKINAFTNANTGTGVITNKAYNDGQWHSLFINFSYNAGSTQIDIYVDGELDISDTRVIFTNASAISVIGAKYDYTPSFLGSIKFPFLWKIALTPTQVKWQHEVLMRQINL